MNARNVVFVVTLFVHATAIARPPDPETIQLARAQKLAKRARFESALKLLKPRLQSSSQTAVPVLAGVCFVALGQDEEAELAFVRALVIDPELDLNTADYNPAARAVFLRAKATLFGELVVQATEPAVQVFEGPQILGQAPVRLKLSIGRHMLRFVNANGERGLETVLKPGEKLVVGAEAFPAQNEKPEPKNVLMPQPPAPTPAFQQKDVAQPATMSAHVAQPPAWKPLLRAVLLGVSIASLIAAGIFYGLSFDRYQRLAGGNVMVGSRAEADAFAQVGQTQQWVAIGLSGLSGACLLSFALFGL